MKLDLELEEPELSYYKWLIENSLEVAHIDRYAYDTVQMKDLSSYNAMTSHEWFDGNRFFSFFDGGYGYVTIAFYALDTNLGLWFQYSFIAKDLDYTE